MLARKVLSKIPSQHWTGRHPFTGTSVCPKTLFEHWEVPSNTDLLRCSGYSYFEAAGCDFKISGSGVRFHRENLAS